jgi:hypothetical protein
MNIHSPSDHALVKPSLDPESRTAGANGRGVDCQGFEKALVVCHLGAHDRTTGDETIEFKIQESSDDGGADAYTDVTGATTGVLGNVVPNATSGNVYLIDLNLAKRERYLRVVTAVAGTTPIDLCSALILLFNPRYAEVTQDGAPVQVL